MQYVTLHNVVYFEFFYDPLKSTSLNESLGKAYRRIFYF